MNKHALVNHNAGTQYRCRVCGAVFDTDDKDANGECVSINVLGCDIPAGTPPGRVAEIIKERRRGLSNKG